jgi:hypothetical protein
MVRKIQKNYTFQTPKSKCALVPPMVERFSARIKSNIELFYAVFVERISARIRSNRQIDGLSTGQNLAGKFESLDYVECSEAIYDENSDLAIGTASKT